MWVPCIAMAMFVAVVLPSPDTAGAGPPSFARISSYFFVAYFIGNPLWGSVLDYIGLRAGMLIGVGVWTLASVSRTFGVG